MKCQKTHSFSVIGTLCFAFVLAYAPIHAEAQFTVPCTASSPGAQLFSDGSGGSYYLCPSGSVAPNSASADSQTSQTAKPFCQNGTCTYIPLEPLPGTQNNTRNTGQSGLTFAQYVGNIFTISIVIGAMITVAVLVIAGITYMTQEALPKKDWARSKIKSALWALLILLGAYLILVTINPSLVNFTFSNTIGYGAAQNCQGTSGTSINPLLPCPYIQQSDQGIGATQSIEQASQLNAQVQQCESSRGVWSTGTSPPSCVYP